MFENEGDMAIPASGAPASLEGSRNEGPGSRFPAALILGITAALLAPFACTSMPDDPYLAFVGTYTDGGAQGIYAYGYDPSTGALHEIGLAAEAVNPSFLTVDSSGRFLYAVNELDRFQGEASGAVSAFSIDHSSGRLTLINMVSSQGAHPCHLTLDRTGRWLFIANYTGGSVAVFPVHEDGSLGAAAQLIHHVGAGPHERQDSAHAHSVDVSADNRFLYVADLGVDQVFIYGFDAESGELTPNTPASVASAAGAGPRHMAFSPRGRFAYLLEELSSTVTGYRVDTESGGLEAIGTVSALPEGFEGASTAAEISVDSGGRFLYVSNRGDNSIAAFAIDPESGTLDPIGHTRTQGETPRFFTIDPEGTHLLVANQGSDSVVVFDRDTEAGMLTPSGQTAEVPSPVAMVFVGLE